MVLKLVSVGYYCETEAESESPSSTTPAGRRTGSEDHVLGLSGRSAEDDITNAAT